MIIAIYPGRFQPFGPHHEKVYEWMVKIFGKSNSFVVTSNHIDEKSPLNFQEKKQVIEKFGVPFQNIVQVTEPYKAKELLQYFNPMMDSCVFVLGRKDIDRINITGKSYFKEYDETKPIYPFAANGYVIEAPHFLINGEDVSGTSLRQNLPNITPEQFQIVMGWYDPKIHKLFKEKFKAEPIQRFIEQFVNDPIIITEGTITKTQLKRIEQYADLLFKEFGIDINFQNLSQGTHFFQRLNDPRNETPISQDDLRRLFKKASIKYGMKLGRSNHGAEGVLKDMETDINLPFIIKWDRDNQELDLVPKTIMRKQNFKTNTQLFQMEDFQLFFEEVTKNTSGRKHIFHPYEDKDLTFGDLRLMFSELLWGTYPDPIYEKVDGQALEICYRNRQILCARNKGDRINPMSKFELHERYKDHENKELVGVFYHTHSWFENVLLKLNQEILTKIFPNPNIFLGLELCYPQTYNVFKYSNNPLIVLHGLIQYDEKGNELNRSPKTGTQIAQIINDKYIVGPNQLNLKKLSEQIFSFPLEYILKKNGLNYQNTINDLEDRVQLETLIHRTGVQILKGIQNPLTKLPTETLEDIMDRLQAIKTEVLRRNDATLTQKFNQNYQKFEEHGGFSSLVPMEGFVFNFKGKTYKIVGSFRYLNQILGLFRYSR